MTEPSALSSGFTDHHCHILAGLDDGASEISESIELAQILAEHGFTKVYCTPHLLKGFYNNHPELVRKSVGDLQEAFYRSDIELKIHAGAEYYLDEYFLDLLEDPLTVFNNFILVEAPERIEPGVIKDVFYRLIIGKKLKPMIAHPERHEAMEMDFKWKAGGFKRFFKALGHGDNSRSQIDPNDPDIADTLPVSLRRMGCKFQGNIGSFAGIYGETVRRRSVNFLESGLYDCLGTDAHHPRELVKFLKRGLREIERIAGKDLMRQVLTGQKLEHAKTIQAFHIPLSGNATNG